MSIEQAYTDWAASYDSDQNLTRDLDEAVTRAALGGLRFDTILEIGCGTGKNTAWLAGIGRRTVALDLTEDMIRRAKAKVRQPNVGFALADLTRPWPCWSGAADLIVCNLVLEHIADLGFIFGEAQRVSAAGGRFFICELHPFRQYMGRKARFERAEGTIEVPAFVHHISDFLAAAGGAGFRLASLREWWHAADTSGPPRVVSFMFER